MKQLLVLSLCCGLAATAFAGKDKLSNTTQPSTDAQLVSAKSVQLRTAQEPISLSSRGELRHELRQTHPDASSKVPVEYPELEVPGVRQGGDTIATAVPITVPYSNTGTTAGYADDYDEVCPYADSTSPDVVYELTIAADGIFEIDLYGSAYDTKLYVYESDGSTLVDCNDDYWSDYTSALIGLSLTAGVYYVVIDGYGGESGAYAINIIENDPCDNYTSTAITLPYTGTGTNVGAPHFYGSSAGDIAYTFTLSVPSTLTLETCLDGTDFDTDSYLFLGNPCAGGSEMLYNDGDSECSFVAYATGWEIACGALDPGDYTLILTGYDTAEGNFAMTLTAEPCECEPIVCEGTPEVEPNNGTNDDPPTYGTIDCGETVCGTTYTYIDGETGYESRDTDFYELLLLYDAILTIDLDVEAFDGVLLLLDGDLEQIGYADDFLYCEDEQLVSDCLEAGTYYIFVAHAYYTGVAVPADYGLTVSCEECIFEPPCETATELICNAAEVPGTNVDARDFVNNESGDVFYFFTVPYEALVSIDLCSTLTDFDTYLALYDSCPTDETTVMLTSNDDGPICDDDTAPYEPSLIDRYLLDPGTYWVVVDGVGTAEGNYGITLTCEEFVCDPIVCVGTPEVEPNNGTNDDPPTFGSIACGETVCGTTYTFTELVDTTLIESRDTDFYQIDLLEDMILTINLEVERFDGVILLLNSDVVVIDSANEGIICEDEVLVSECLQAGTYYVFVAHNGYTGVDTPASYGLTVTCEPCVWISPYTTCQEPVTPDDSWSFGNMNLYEGYVRAERFGNGGTISGIDFQGLGAYYDGGWLTCDPGAVDIEVTFYELDGDTMGAVVSTQTVTASMVANGYTFSGFAAYDVHLDLTTPVTLAEGIFSMQEQGPDCWLLWGSSVLGADDISMLYDGTAWGYESNDLGFCFVMDCDPVTDLLVTVISNDTQLSWTPVAGASDYKVYASTEAYGTYTEIATTGGAASYDDIGALANNHKFYKVVSVCE